MGRVVLKCLLQEDPKIRVMIADRQSPSTPLPKHVRFKKVNLLHHGTLVKVLRGHTVVINSTSHHFNLPVMKAALAAKVHYLDLGGLFHFTRRQLKLNLAFKKKGLTAVLGMGCAPGVANLLAQWAAEGMDRVKEVHIKVGGRSWGPPSDDIPYAIGTIREELTLKPPIVKAGRWCFAPPRSGVEIFNFPAPVGRQKIFRTIHSEVATLPLHFRGVKEASFKIGFSDEMIKAVLAPRRKKVSSPKPSTAKVVRDCEITAAVVSGAQGEKKRSRNAFYVAHSHEGHPAGDWNTAWPPAIVSIVMARGEISCPGVYAPEDIVPFQQLFKRLRKRGFKIFVAVP